MQPILTSRVTLILFLLLTVTTARAQVIRGLVLEPDGTPHAGARVEIVSDTLLNMGLPYRQRPASVAVGKTSARGHFGIDASGMAPGIEYSLFVVTDGFADRRVPGLKRPERAEHNIGVLKLAPGAPITGTVFDSNQKPAAGVTVRWFPQPDQWADPRPYAPARDDGWVAKTDAKGRFSLAHLPSGEGTLTAAKADFAVDTRPVIARIENPWDARMTLLPGKSKRGVITDQKKKPVPNARVFVLMRPGFVRTSPCAITRTDKQGRYVLPVPVGPRTMVFVQAPGLVGTRFTPAPSSSRVVNLTLGNPLMIQVRVKTADGVAVPRFAARVVTPRTAIPMTGFTTSKARGGLASIPSNGRGQYQIEVRVPGYAPGLSEAVQVGFRNTPRPIVEVVLDQGGAARGQVVDATGKPVPGAKIELHYGPVAFNTTPTATNLNWHGHQKITLVTDPDGRFEVQRLRPQKYVLFASHKGFVRTIVRATVEKGQTHDFNRIKLLRGVSVHGKTTWNGKPAARIKVILRSETTRLSFEVISDENGAFKLDKPIPPGRYMAMAGSMPGGDAGQPSHEFGKNLKRIELPSDKREYTLDFKLK